MGKKLLAAGQLADALSHFHAAIGTYVRKLTLAQKYLCLRIFFLLFASLSMLLSYKFHSMSFTEVGTSLCSSLDGSQQRCSRIFMLQF